MIVAGRYKILGRLAQGGTATIYRAYDPKKNRTVVLKTINPDRVPAGGMNECRQRLFREAHVLRELTHPGIVSLFDVGENFETRMPYLVMEYIKGQTLAKLVWGGQLPLETALDLVRQVAEALGYLHRQGIVHHDFRLVNIMVTPEGQAKLIDFGMAKKTSTYVIEPVIQMPAWASSYLTLEQITGSALDGRRDLFALGEILLQFLCYARKNVQPADPIPPPRQPETAVRKLAPRHEAERAE